MSDEKISAEQIGRDIYLHGLGDFTSCDIQGTLKIKGDIKADFLTFTDCIFRGAFRFQDATLPELVEFVNCTFEGPVVFHTLGHEDKCHGKIVFYECEARSIVFKEILGINSLIIQDDCKIKTVELDRCKIAEDFLCNASKISRLRMTTCRIGDVHFGWNEMTSNLMIRDARFHALDIDHGKIGDLDLYEVYTDRITINSAQIEGIKFVDVAGSQSFLQSSFSNDCSIKCSEGHSKIDAGGDLTITGCTFNKPLRISDKSVSFRVVNIDCSDTITGAIIFKQCSIVDLNFSGTNTSADLAFSRVHLQNIRITNFTNRNALAFSGCTVADSSILYIGGSDLGEARFLEHDFSRYTDVKIQHSFISEIKFASCKWFAFGKLETDAEDKNKSKRETFRQLKQAAERQNDRIQSLIFQAEELRQHEEELKVANRVLSRDYLTLWLMRQTNSYGLDWGKPLWLLFIVTTVFFVPMAVYASPKLSWASIEFWDGVKVIAHNRIALFVQLFNPARNPFTFVDKDNVHPAYFILDGIHRIIAAFLIVQIVSAFRKYIR